ncbi:MAG TPA: VOC family protein [Vicinamibacterales bacterium]|nr:VOC family protein [Vicinamibacterales bacterium]
MSQASRYIPEGYHSVTPYIVVDGADRAIDFYRRAFGAEELLRMPGPGGKISHAEIRIGDSIVMLADPVPGTTLVPPSTLGGTTASLMIYVPDVDATYRQAVSAGATARQEPADMFWGDRFGKLADPFGHEWMLATHVEDVAPEEMERRMAAMRQT